MEYFLRLGTLGNPPKVPIEHGRFLELKTARLVMNSALALEEEYEIGLHPYDWTGRVRRAWSGNPSFSNLMNISSNSSGGMYPSAE
jgi:hypothetical protein